MPHLRKHKFWIKKSIVYIPGNHLQYWLIASHSREERVVWLKFLQVHCHWSAIVIGVPLSLECHCHWSAIVIGVPLSLECHCLLVFFYFRLTVLFKFPFSSALNESFRIFHGFMYYSFMWHLMREFITKLLAAFSVMLILQNCYKWTLFVLQKIFQWCFVWVGRVAQLV